MVKSDLAFAKQRCAQLEEENKVLRENRNGDNSHTDDDDMVSNSFLLFYKAIQVHNFYVHFSSLVVYMCLGATSTRDIIG